MKGRDKLREPSVSVSVRDVSVRYGRRPVLSAVSFDVGRGDFWFFVGPNGAGKTTLLTAILGNLEPVSGRIEMGDRRDGELRIGFVPQRCDIRQGVPTTAGELVELGLVGVGTGRAAARERVESALAQAGLAGFAERSYWELSGGQRQRVLVARALARQPSLLIADEPTSGLDLTAEHELLVLLGELNERDGLTVILVTHELDIVSAYASHIALFGGGCVKTGTAKEVLTHSNLSLAYGAGASTIIERKLVAYMGAQQPS